jgi:hypothetical protein
MTGWRDDQLEALHRALTDFDHLQVHRLCQQSIAEVRSQPGPIDPEVGLSVLKMLQRKRYIGLVQDLAETLLAHGLHEEVAVRHRYALALVDHDRIAAAEALLAVLPADVRRTDTEVQGAIGRVHKQRYVITGPAAGSRRAADLGLAIEAYAAAYRDDPARNYYHGINAAALLVRATEDSVVVPNHPEPAAEAVEIAEAILASISSGRQPDFWECATATEACLVLNRHDDAVDWLARYLGSDADAFEYASTLRQQQQVWRLTTDTEPGLRLIPMLRNRLLQAEGGMLSVAPIECTPEALRRFDEVQQTLQRRSGTQHYERVYGWDRFHPIGWLRQALVTCRSVARLEDSYGNGCGTGFVLAGDQFRAGWPSRVLLTNAHVVPDTVAVEDAFITFRGLVDEGPDTAARVQPAGDMLWCSPKHELDACFLALPDTLNPEVAPLPVRPAFPTLSSKAQVRAYVIGHPLGSPQIQLSLHDSVVLAAGEVYAHYRSPTETGSSGSPVFDERWRVIALHHGWTDSLPGIDGAGSAANEGIRLDRLRAALAEEVSSGGPAR